MVLLDVVLQEIKFQGFEWPFQLLGQISSVGACQREREKKKKREVIDMYTTQLTTSGKPPEYLAMLTWLPCAEM